MPIIGCTKEDNCKRDAFLKAKRLEAERTAGIAPFRFGAFRDITNQIILVDAKILFHTI